MTRKYTGKFIVRISPALHEKLVKQVLGVSAIYLPSKKWCLRAKSCTACPRREYCLPGLVSMLFGRASGLVQLLAYTYFSLRDERSLYGKLQKHYRLEERARSLSSQNSVDSREEA